MGPAYIEPLPGPDDVPETFRVFASQHPYGFVALGKLWPRSRSELIQACERAYGPRVEFAWTPQTEGLVATASIRFLEGVGSIHPPQVPNYLYWLEIAAATERLPTRLEAAGASLQTAGEAVLDYQRPLLLMSGLCLLAALLLLVPTG